MKTLTFLLIFIVSFNIASCCHCKKPQKAPAANEVLKDRNTRDPKIDSLNNKKVDKALPGVQ